MYELKQEEKKSISATIKSEFFNDYELMMKYWIRSSVREVFKGLV